MVCSDHMPSEDDDDDSARTRTRVGDQVGRYANCNGRNCTGGVVVEGMSLSIKADYVFSGEPLPKM